MLQPQLRVGVMLGIYQGETIATLTTMDNVLQGVESAKELVIRRKTAELGFKDKCPKGRNQQNERARARAYVVVENLQQNPMWSGYEIVRIPLPNGEILEVQGERPEKDPRSLACIKADEKKLDDIRVVRDFPEVFPDDLSGLPPVRERQSRKTSHRSESQAASASCEIAHTD
ncbi:hypothetical protein Tco_0785422 [Tanacetum coccineum]